MDQSGQLYQEHFEPVHGICHRWLFRLDLTSGQLVAVD
jgi:hypothetical protein